MATTPGTEKQLRRVSLCRSFKVRYLVSSFYVGRYFVLSLFMSFVLSFCLYFFLSVILCA